MKPMQKTCIMYVNVVEEREKWPTVSDYPCKGFTVYLVGSLAVLKQARKSNRAQPT
jgi:hypothetical protein